MVKKDILGSSIADLYVKFGTSATGLTKQEAAGRLEMNGPNVLRRREVGAWKVLGSQFKSSLIYLLIIASIISYGIGDYSGGTVILVILVINTTLGFLQEYRSERIVERLSKLIGHEARVRRNGETVLINDSQIVAGDIVIVREGDIVPADIRLIEAEGLQVNESQLTGESVPLAKQVSTGTSGSQDCLTFTGSVIERGGGAGLAYAVGNDTEIGTIAKLSTGIKKETQYEKSLASFSSFLMKVMLFGLVLVLIFKLFLDRNISNLADLLLFIVATAVAVVPEVLPVIATVTMSDGAMKLAKRHVVVKRLSSLEDLGNVNLLCTDKTGTLTENKMSIKKITSTDEKLFQLLSYAAITHFKGGQRKLQNSYDEAFTEYIPDSIKKEAEDFRIAKELPFDPEDRRSRVVLEDVKRKKYFLLSIGAPEAVSDVSGGGYKVKYADNITAEGKQGLHHLALAYKGIPYTDDLDILKNERDLIFLGYASLEDPLRGTAKSTIQLAERLGISIKILTGDSKEVAEYIGKEVGLVNGSDRIYLGSELDSLTEDEFKEVVSRCNVFARVSPTQKFNIIKVLKETNVVGYQGDGINDAPALKLADVAIAVNSATDIAKESADIILLNKSLEVIVNGVKYGRSIFVNINKYIRYTMVSNFGNFIALSTLYLMSTYLPILPIQVLLTTVVTDVPLITISSDTVEETAVVRPEKHNIKELIFISLILGVPTALFEIFYFLLISAQPRATMETSLFMFLTFIALIVFYTIRNKGYFWKTKLPSGILNMSFALAAIFSLAIIYMPPFQLWFSFVPLPLSSLILILVLITLYFLGIDSVKVLYYRLAGSEGGV